jgi:FkbM family methyltransferase
MLQLNMAMLVSYPNLNVAKTKPPLITDPVVLHQFDWTGWAKPIQGVSQTASAIHTNKQNPKMWMQTENQMYHRNLKLSKSPYQSGNLQAFKICLADRSNGVILDVGANIGLMAHQFALWGATVLAFEPVPKIAEMCAHNLVLNDVSDKVTLHQVAVLDFVGPVVFHDTPNQSYINARVINSHIPARPKKNGIRMRFTVDGITIDSLNLGLVDGIKIDVEGHEFEVVLGAVDTIKRCRPVVMAEMLKGHFKGFHPDEMYDFFLNQDYVVFDKGHQAHGRNPQPCGTKWCYVLNRADKIFVPKEQIHKFSLFN